MVVNSPYLKPIANESMIDRILSINPKEVNAAVLYVMYAQAQNKTDIYNKYLAVAQKNRRPKSTGICGQRPPHRAV